MIIGRGLGDARAVPYLNIPKDYGPAAPPSPAPKGYKWVSTKSGWKLSKLPAKAKPRPHPDTVQPQPSGAPAASTSAGGPPSSPLAPLQASTIFGLPRGVALALGALVVIGAGSFLLRSGGRGRLLSMNGCGCRKKKRRKRPSRGHGRQGVSRGRLMLPERIDEADVVDNPGIDLPARARVRRAVDDETGTPRELLHKAMEFRKEFAWGNAPKRVGKQKLYPRPRVLVTLGKLAAVTYRTQKADEKAKYYYHEFEGRLPRLAMDVENKKLHITGGSYTVTGRGIEG